MPASFPSLRHFHHIYTPTLNLFLPSITLPTPFPPSLPPRLSFTPQWSPRQALNAAQNKATFNASWQADWAELGTATRHNTSYHTHDPKSQRFTCGVMWCNCWLWCAPFIISSRVSTWAHIAVIITFLPQRWAMYRWAWLFSHHCGYFLNNNETRFLLNTLWNTENMAWCGRWWFPSNPWRFKLKWNMENNNQNPVFW